jgi:hypothetical protein
MCIKNYIYKLKRCGCSSSCTITFTTLVHGFWSIIFSYDFNIYIWYCFFFQISIFFVWCKFSFKVIITCIRGIIKILNVMVFHFINLYLRIFEHKISNLNVRLIILIISMSCFIFLGGYELGLQFSKLLRFCSINFLSNNDLNPYKLLNSNY